MRSQWAVRIWTQDLWIWIQPLTTSSQFKNRYFNATFDQILCFAIKFLVADSIIVFTFFYCIVLITSLIKNVCKGVCNSEWGVCVCVGVCVCLQQEREREGVCLCVTNMRGNDLSVIKKSLALQLSLSLSLSLSLPLTHFFSLMLLTSPILIE